MLTLKYAKMSVVAVWPMTRYTEWRMVIMVISRDAPNADWTNICLLRESPTLLQRYSGAATRETSAMISAAKKKFEDHPNHRKCKEVVLTDQLRERHRRRH